MDEGEGNVPTQKYSIERKLEVLAAVDSGMQVEDVADKYGIPTNTIYTWTKDSGRRRISALSQLARGGNKQKKNGLHKAPPKVKVIPKPKPATTLQEAEENAQALLTESRSPENKVARLELENAMLRKWLKALKESAGVDF